MNEGLTTKDIIFIVGFLITMCKIVYDAGYLSAIIKQNVSDIKTLRETDKRIHCRIDEMQCISKKECYDQSNKFETRLEEYQSKLCDLLEKSNDKQSEMMEAIIRLESKS